MDEANQKERDGGWGGEARGEEEKGKARDRREIRIHIKHGLIL